MTGKGLSVVVLVGTDHHPFERIVRWADQWATSHPDDDVFVQHGHTDSPNVARGAAFVSPADLGTILQSAHVAIIHGGPGTLAEARYAGHRPIVVPRDPEKGEHVDSHQ